MPEVEQSFLQQFKDLNRNFEPGEVKQRKLRRNSDQTVDYIDIATTLARVNEVLGHEWSVFEQFTNVYPPTDGQDNWNVLIGVSVTALDKNAFGVGAGMDRELDNAAKTALAEAIKKAFHQFGVAMELWDEEFRALVAEAREPKAVVRGRPRVR